MYALYHIICIYHYEKIIIVFVFISVYRYTGTLTISVGKKNQYGRPNKEVLDIINDSIIYRTDIDDSVVFKMLNKRLLIGLLIL